MPPAGAPESLNAPLLTGLISEFSPNENVLKPKLKTIISDRRLDYTEERFGHRCVSFNFSLDDSRCLLASVRKDISTVDVAYR